MKYYLSMLLILISGWVFCADLHMEGWTEVPVGGTVIDPVTKVYTKTEGISGLQIRSIVTHSVSINHKNDNVIHEVEIRGIDEGDDKYLNIARCVSLRGSDHGFWMFLNSFNDKYQVYGGLAGNEGVYFAKANERFITITPKNLKEGTDFWVVMLIADSQGVYRVYDKSDYKKYDSKIKK